MFAKKLQKTLPQKYRYKHNAYCDIFGERFHNSSFYSFIQTIAKLCSRNGTGAYQSVSGRHWESVGT